MVISAFSDYASISGWQFIPRSRYVISESMFKRAALQLEPLTGNKSPIHSWSSVNSYERRYGGQDSNGRTILIYRENAFGDQLMVSALVRYIKHLYPETQIDVHAVPHMEQAWWNNKDARFIGCPPTFDSLKTADFHLLMEGLIENDSEPEQSNAYDNLFSFAGFHPFSVPPEFKRPHIVWGPGDDKCAAVWKEHKPWRYVLWHVCPSSPVRMLPIALQEQAISLIAEHLDVVMVGLQDGAPMPGIQHPRVHDWTNRTGNWRSLLPMIREAECVVAPDSSVLHAVGAFPDVPLVGLWGSFGANDRAKYYTNHTGLDAHHLCPFSPCRAPQADFPVHKCVQSVGWENSETPWCSAMKINPERIAETVVKLAR